MSELMLSRMQVIQAFINRMRYRRYLEIGVEEGNNFFIVRAPYKTAVDPSFQIPRLRWARNLVRHPTEIRNRYFEMTSDEYFDRERARLQREGVDIVFVDGAHVYEQCHRDILHSLEHLRSDGVVIVHDCNPPSEYAAESWSAYQESRRARPEGWTGEWCGDVWKAIARLRVERPDLGVCVLDCDYGIGIVVPFTFAGAGPRPPFTVREIERMSYADFVAHRATLIGLRPPEDLDLVIAAASARPAA